MANSSSTTAENVEIISDDSRFTLPEEIVTDILSRLPVKSVFQSQCISKSFSSITKDPYFIDLHIRQSSRLRPSIIVNNCDGISFVRCSSPPESEITSEPVTLHPHFDRSYTRISSIVIVGSCNGLVVVVVDKEETILWNPAIVHRVCHIPTNGRVPGWLSEISWGFGYCNESRDYKIVRIACFEWPKPNSMKFKFLAEVFTYDKDRVWRRLDFSKFNVMCFGHVITVNGVVHWQIDNDDRLLTFDLAKEKFAWLFCPVTMITQIMEFKGSLVACAKSRINEISFDLWVLKDENCCNGKSWEKIYTTIEFLTNMEPLRCMNDRCVLFINLDGKNLGATIDTEYPCYLYDLERREIKKNTGLFVVGHWSDVQNYVDSIVTLNQLDGLNDGSEYNSSNYNDEVDTNDDSGNSEDETVNYEYDVNGGKNNNVIDSVDGNDNDEE